MREGVLVADSRNALLVWEPGRVVPGYAIPEADLRVRLAPSGDPPEITEPDPVIPPHVPFTVHSCAGTAFDVVVDGEVLAGAAFRPADRDLSGTLLLDIDRFAWMEEDDPVRGHPRDPFHRVDVRRASRHVRLDLTVDGVTESASRHPRSRGGD